MKKWIQIRTMTSIYKVENHIKGPRSDERDIRSSHCSIPGTVETAYCDYRLLSNLIWMFDRTVYISFLTKIVYCDSFGPVPR